MPLAKLEYRENSSRPIVACGIDPATTYAGIQKMIFAMLGMQVPGFPADQRDHETPFSRAKKISEGFSMQIDRLLSYSNTADTQPREGLENICRAVLAQLDAALNDPAAPWAATLPMRDMQEMPAATIAQEAPDATILERIQQFLQAGIDGLSTGEAMF